MQHSRKWTCWFGVFGGLLSAMLFMTKAQAEPNLLPNPGFEGVRQWQGTTIPSNWFVSDWEKARDEDIPDAYVGGGIVKSPAHSGTTALKMAIGDQEWYKAGNTTVYVMSQYKSKIIKPLPTEKALDFSFWFYRKDMTARGDFLVQFHKDGTDGSRMASTNGARITFSQDGATSDGGPPTTVIDEAQGWSQVMVKGILIPVGYNAATVALRLSAGKPGEYLYVDDISLVPGEAQIAQAVTSTQMLNKKLIYYGWDAPDTKYLRANAEQFRQMPFDGVGFKIAIDRNKPTAGDGATENQLGWHLFGPRAFALEDFKESIEDLKAAKKAKLELFPAVCVATRDQDKGITWFDDERWKTITNNWKVMVGIAKAGGCKGILFDPEHYDYEPELFSYKHHSTQRVNKSFAEYSAQARKRGREMMQAVGSIYPDMTMFCIFAYDLGWLDYENTKILGNPNGRYGLLPAFLDGMLEGAHEKTKWVDAWEFAYAYKERQKFLEAYHTVLNKIPSHGLTQVPDLYRSKMRVGFGLMLDYPYGPEGRLPWNTTDLSKNYYSPAEFGRSLQYALDTSDEYVWVYSERAGFSPPKDLPPAYLDAIKSVHSKAE